MNRGMLNSPLCIVYGIAAVIITIGFPELFDEVPILFLGCAGSSLRFSSGLQQRFLKNWIIKNGGTILLKDGILMDTSVLQYSIVWGILGVLSVKFVTPVLMKFYHMVPSFMMQITLWGLPLGVLIVEYLGIDIYHSRQCKEK